MRTETFPAPFAALVAFGLAGTAGLASAEANPWYLGASQAFGHDSNLYRSAGNELPDKYSITSLIAGLDQPFGRQRLRADIALRATRFEDVRELDHSGHQIGASLDWQTVERLSGRVELSSAEKLATYGSSVNQPQLTKKNLERIDQFVARAHLGLVSLLALEAGVQHRRLDYSAPEYAGSELRQNTVSAGLRVRPGGALSYGIGGRYTRGEYPNVLLPNGEAAEFSRKDIDLTAQWEPTGLSRFDARLSWGKQLSEALQSRDFSGTTGSLSWTFLPTGKLRFVTTLSRETGSESTFLGYGNGDNSRLTNSLGLNAQWDATAKIRVTAGLRYSRRELRDQVVATGFAPVIIEGNDTLKSLSLGASYAPARSMLLGCNSMREIRSADNAALSTSYRVSTTQCSAQLTLQ